MKNSTTASPAIAARRLTRWRSARCHGAAPLSASSTAVAALAPNVSAVIRAASD